MKLYLIFGLLVLCSAVPAFGMDQDIDANFFYARHDTIQFVSKIIQLGAQERPNIENAFAHADDRIQETPELLQGVPAAITDIVATPVDTDNQSQATARAVSQLPNASNHNNNPSDDDDDYPTPNQLHHEENDALRQQH